MSIVEANYVTVKSHDCFTLKSNDSLHFHTSSLPVEAMPFDEPVVSKTKTSKTKTRRPKTYENEDPLRKRRLFNFFAGNEII